MPFDSRGSAGPAGATGAAGAQGAQGPAGADGLSAPDWAAHEDGVPVIGDWFSASTVGGATGVYKESRELGVRMRTDKAVNGTTDTDGNRVQGLLHAVSAGDFIVGIRVAFDAVNTPITDAISTLEGTAVFVDGASAANDSFVGIGNYWTATFMRQAIFRRLQNVAGANRFETATANTIVSSPGLGGGPFDFFFVRTGTSLAGFVGAPGAIPQLAYTWTVSAGAGMLGVRIQHSAGTAVDCMALIQGYRVFASLPW